QRKTSILAVMQRDAHPACQHFDESMEWAVQIHERAVKRACPRRRADAANTDYGTHWHIVQRADRPETPTPADFTGLARNFTTLQAALGAYPWLCLPRLTVSRRRGRPAEALSQSASHRRWVRADSPRLRLRVKRRGLAMLGRNQTTSFDNLCSTTTNRCD